MENWLETHRSLVFPWHCDQFGHMNVRWYAHFFDDATFHMWTMSGLSYQRFEELGAIMVVAHTGTDFIREMKAGQLLVIRSAFTGIGNKSVKYTANMFDADTDVLCARQRSVEVCFDQTTRRSTAMPDGIRDALATRIVSDEG